MKPKRKKIYGVPIKEYKGVTYVDPNDIPEQHKKEFGEWFNGQTGMIVGGKCVIYSWDWERWMDWKTGKSKYLVFD